MTRRPAPPITAREAAVARAFDEAPVLPEAWRPEHSTDCTPELRSNGMYAVDCERCERSTAEFYARIRRAAS